MFGVPDNVNAVEAVIGLGSVYDSMEKYGRTSSYHKRALKICDQEFDVQSINPAEALTAIGSVCESL
jgi:hypothetical protein